MTSRFHKIFFFLYLLISLCSVYPAQADEARPVVMFAGFQSRVSRSNVTLTKLSIDPDRIVSLFADKLTVLLANDPRYDFYDTDATTTRARMDETALMNSLGEGVIIPSLQNQADYIVYGYLTNSSQIKAQIGALGLNGKDKTIHLELSIRVMDAHTGAIVFTATADSRRKSELTYHAILTRNDQGVDDAINSALDIAAQNLANKFQQAA